MDNGFFERPILNSPLRVPRALLAARRAGAAHRRDHRGASHGPTPVINELRHRVNQWRGIGNPSAWGVTPETARLLQHGRHHEFTRVRPIFCQIEAVKTVRSSRPPARQR
jgi:hypothetical protein